MTETYQLFTSLFIALLTSGIDNKKSILQGQITDIDSHGNITVIIVRNLSRNVRPHNPRLFDLCSAIHTRLSDVLLVH